MDSYIPPSFPAPPGLSCWIQTYTGARVNLLDPNPADIHVEDIATGLSSIARFYGHTDTRHVLSVAQHSIKMSFMVSPQNAPWALFHDSAEAYTGDFHRPLKKLLPFIHDIEMRILWAVTQRFGLPWPIPDEIAQADNTLAAWEARDLMRPSLILPADVAPPADTHTQPYDRDTAHQEFIRRFDDLNRNLGRFNLE